MSATYAEKEREFVAALAEDTGKDLAGWMDAIARSGHTQRNDIIDWLRHQGFQFSWASWLERIHHNGGRLIYGPESSGETRIQSRSPSVRDLIDEEPPSRQRLFPEPSRPAPPDKSVQDLLADAKGLRPLAEHILREVGHVLPETRFEVAGPLVMMSAPKPFAALHPAPKRIRLYANFGATPRSKSAETINKSPPPFPQMLVLDDVRSIDEEFRRMIVASAR